MADDTEVEQACKICRTEATPESPLFFPCSCSGSIKYVHQDCLQDWLRHSGSTRCELCHHPYKFTPIYAPNAPKFDIQLVLDGVLRFVATQSRLLARYAMLVICWCILLPYLTTNMWTMFVPWVPPASSSYAPPATAAASAAGAQDLHLFNEYGSAATGEVLQSSSSQTAVEQHQSFATEVLHQFPLNVSSIIPVGYEVLQRLFLIPSSGRQLLEMLLHGMGLCLLMFVVHAAFFSVLDYLQSYQEQERLLRRAMRQQQQAQPQQQDAAAQQDNAAAADQNQNQPPRAEENDAVEDDNNNPNEPEAENGEEEEGDGDEAGEAEEIENENENENEGEANAEIAEEMEGGDEDAEADDGGAEREMDIEEFLGLKGPIGMIMWDMLAVSVYIFCALLLLVGVPDFAGRAVVWLSQRTFAVLAGWLEVTSTPKSPNAAVSNVLQWLSTTVATRFSNSIGEIKLLGFTVGSGASLWNAASNLLTRAATAIGIVVVSSSEVPDGAGTGAGGGLLLGIASALAKVPVPIWGYAFLLPASLLIYRRKSYRVMVKVILLFLLELVLMPVCLGWVMQWSTRGLFGSLSASAAPPQEGEGPTDAAAAIASEWGVLSVAAGLLVGTPYETGARIIVRWILGFLTMLLWARVVRVIRDSVRPGLLWFIRFNDDAEWSLFRSFVQDDVKLHLRRTAETFAFHAAAVLGLVFIPLWILRSLPELLASSLSSSSSLAATEAATIATASSSWSSWLLQWLPDIPAATTIQPLLPISLAAIQHYRSPADFALLHVALPFSLDLLRSRHSMQTVMRYVLRLCSRVLGLEEFVMPPQQPVTAAPPARPRALVVRVVLLLILGWQVALWFAVGTTVTVLLSGRFVVRRVLGLGPRDADFVRENPFDLYHLIFGIYLVALGFRALSHVAPAAVSIATSCYHRIFVRHQQQHQPLWPVLRRILRALPVIILGGLVIPLLAGVLLEWTLFGPHQTLVMQLDAQHAHATSSFDDGDELASANSANTTLTWASALLLRGFSLWGFTPALKMAESPPPVEDASLLSTATATSVGADDVIPWHTGYAQAWFFGVVIVRLLYGLLTTSEAIVPEALRRRLQAIANDGVGDNVNLWSVLFGLIIPVIALETAVLLLPPPLVRTCGVALLRAISPPGVAAWEPSRWASFEALLTQLAHLIFAVVATLVAATVWLTWVAIQSYRQLRDERYVVGHQLHNRAD